MKFIRTISTTGVDGDYTPVNGLQQSEITFVRSDNNSTLVDYSFFNERGHGQYEFGDFDVPEVTLNTSTGQWNPSVVLVLLRINGVIQTRLGEIPVWNDTYIPVSQGDLFVRADRLGDEIYNFFTYSQSLSAVNGFNPFTPPQDSYYRLRIPAIGWINDNFATIGSVSSITSGLSSYMPLSGGTFIGPVTFNTTNVNAVATKFNFQSATGDWKYISVSSAIVNNGSLNVYNNLGTTPAGDLFKLSYLNTDQDTVTPFRVYHDSAELPHADFSTTPLTGTGTWKLSDLKIPTSASKYITGNLVNDDYAHVKWINDNFQSINSSYQSNTVIVDAKATEDITLKVYSSITGAIAGIIDETGGTTSANIWSIIVKQHYNITGYVENIEVPDWINIVGEGQVYVSGQLTRSATGTVISSKLENLNFYVNNSAQNVERFEAINCIFTSASDGDIDIESSIVRNCGFYSNNVQSSNNNKVFNCFGNQSIVWQANDKVYSYDFITGESYN
jgi:hypothetical protein